MSFRLTHIWRALVAFAAGGVLLPLARADLFMLVPGITGESTVAGFVGWSALTDAGAAFDAPPPAHGPLTVVKLADSVSPLLFESLTVPASLGEVEIRQRLTASPGYRAIRIKDARVVAMRQYLQGTSHVDEITFAYDRFEWIDFDGTDVWWDFINQKGDITPGNNTAPTIAPIGPQTTNEDVAKTINVTVGDDETMYNLSVTAATNNATLLPPARITITGTGAARTVTMNPVANRSGLVHVTLTVSDGILSTGTAFDLTVNAVNDPPTIDPVAAQSTLQNTPLDVGVTIADLETAAASLTLSGSSSNTAVLANTGFAFSGTTGHRTVTLTPVANAVGTTTVTLLANDGALNSAPRTFSFNVTLPPTAPSAITLTPNSVPENSPAGTLVGTLTATDANPGDTHTFTLLDSAGGRFALAGSTITATGAPLLDFETATSHALSVRATDSTALQFTGPVTVNVSAVNEAPSIAAAAAPGLKLVRGFSAALPAITVADPDAASLTVTLSSAVVNFTVAPPVAGVTLSNNGTGNVTLSGSVARLNTSLAAGTVQISPATNQPPGAPVDVALSLSVSDLGSSGAGGTLTAAASVNVRLYRHRIELWREEHFTAAELGNAALEATLWGNHADPDGDGGRNVAEYAFARDPRVADASLAPVPVLAPGGDGQPRLHLSVPVRRDDPELAVTFVSSGDLAAWSGATVEALPTSPIDAEYELRTVRDSNPVSATQRRFLRANAVLTLD